MKEQNKKLLGEVMETMTVVGLLYLVSMASFPRGVRNEVSR